MKGMFVLHNPYVKLRDSGLGDIRARMKKATVRARMLNTVRVWIVLIYCFSIVARAQSMADDLRNHSRYARAIKTPPTIEVLVVADESMVKFHGNASIREYLLTVMAKVRLPRI